MGELDIKADKEGVEGKVSVPIELPKIQGQAELTGEVATDFKGKKKSWFAGFKLRW